MAAQMAPQARAIGGGKAAHTGTHANANPPLRIPTTVSQASQRPSLGAACHMSADEVLLNSVVGESSEYSGHSATAASHVPASEVGQSGSRRTCGNLNPIKSHTPARTPSWISPRCPFTNGTTLHTMSATSGGT